MLDTQYLLLEFDEVIDLNDFYRERLPEIIKIKSLISSLRLMYSLPPKNINLYVSKGARVYRLDMYDNRKILFGQLYYLPLQKQVDIYTSEDIETPVLQWKNKKAVTKNYNRLFLYSDIDKVFERLIGIL